MSYSVKMAIQCPRTCSGAVAPAVKPTPAPPKDGQRGGPSPPSSFSQPRQVALSVHSPVVATSVHAPGALEKVPRPQR